MATNSFLSNINLNKNELQNAVVQNLNDAPANPKAGQLYYSLSDNTVYVWNGTSWVDALNQGEIYTFSTGLTESEGTVTLNSASTSAIGGVILASDDDVAAGTNTSKAITPAQLATKVTKNDAITAATKCKITYDAKGLVTAGADLEASDIPSLTLAKISDVTASAAEVNVLDGITATTAELNILDGVTADKDELNILDGATLTTTELNYVDGVTSNIQTQLDGKVAKNADITAGTKCKITYDAKGLVTAGADLAASDIPDISATYVTVASKGVANGVAPLDANSKIDASYLPSYVDDVMDAYIVSGSTALSAGWLSATADGAALTPETGKIYVVLTAGQYLNKTYRWSGSTYVEISAAPGQATESAAGIAAIATTAEVAAGSDDTKFVTPAKLAGHTAGMAKVSSSNNPLLSVSSGQCTWTISSTPANAVVSVYEVSSGNQVYPEVVLGSGSITIKMNASTDIAANTYKAVVIG